MQHPLNRLGFIANISRQDQLLVSGHGEIREGLSLLFVIHGDLCFWRGHPVLQRSYPTKALRFSATLKPRLLMFRGFWSRYTSPTLTFMTPLPAAYKAALIGYEHWQRLKPDL